MGPALVTIDQTVVPERVVKMEALGKIRNPVLVRFHGDSLRQGVFLTRF